MSLFNKLLFWFKQQKIKRVIKTNKIALQQVTDASVMVKMTTTVDAFNALLSLTTIDAPLRDIIVVSVITHHDSIEELLDAIKTRTNDIRAKTLKTSKHVNPPTIKTIETLLIRDKRYIDFNYAIEELLRSVKNYRDAYSALDAVDKNVAMRVHRYILVDIATIIEAILSIMETHHNAKTIY